MWKIRRNFVFPRWHSKKQNPAENIKGPVPQNAVICMSISSKAQYSNKNHEKSERQYKDSRKYWNCNQFQFLLSRHFFMETAGWLGTVTALCFNIHFKQFNVFYNHERGHSHCLFSRNVLAMPKISADINPPNKPLPEAKVTFVPNDADVNSEKNECLSKAIQLKAEILQYSAASSNSAGISFLRSSSKEAYHCFQTAARLGSSQGLYNLGLCYELGKGTKINLNRAAFCYRKAAMKGHGAASYNLAIYFLKGLGGLPVEPETARLLIAEAADKGVPEAQKYIGLEYLEDKRYSEAYEIFDSLDKQNDLDGKYYLGLCFENGWGVQKSEKIALEIFSKGASLGHMKSTLQLSKCYENGFEGCKCDLNFALALCQTVADQGNEEGMLAVSRIKSKQERTNVLNMKSSAFSNNKPNLQNSSSESHIHDKSSKVPCSLQNCTSSYLNLIMPFFPIRQSSLGSTKSSFYIGEENNFLTGIQTNQLRLLTATST